MTYDTSTHRKQTMRNNPKETKNEASSKSSEDTKWENLDPNDPNYKHHQLISKIQKEINDLPHGWKRNEKFGTQRNEPPYIHDDGRVSWKNPNYDKIQAAMEVAKKEEEKEALNSNNDYEVISSKEGEKKIDCRLLKKYRLMVQRGVPIGAVKQSAQVIDNIELDDSDLLETENKKKSSISTKDHSKLQEEKDVKRSNDSKDRVEVKAANHHSSFKTDQEKAMIKKYKRMMKSGMPLAAIKNMAQREFRVADIDNLLPHFLTDESKEKEIQTEQNNSFHYFKISPDGTELEFSLSDDRTIAGKSYLARLVQKMVLTVNRSKVRYNSIKGKEAVITASTKDLYNAIGALRGIRLSRDSYNSVCDSYNSMTESEIQSKRKAFLELLRSLGVSLPTCPREKIDIKGLDELIEYIEKQYEKQLTEIKNTLSVGMYDFDSLVEIYKPGSRVVAKSVFVSGVDMICEVSWSRFEEGKTLFGISRSFKVCFQFIFAVGEHFTMCEYVKSIENFDGRRYLQSLDFIPLFSYDDESLKSLRATFRQRGEIYAKCATGSNYMAYEKGSFFSKSGRGDRTKALRMAGRVMVDTQGSYENGHSISIGNDLIITDIKQKHKEYKLLMRSQKKKMESGLDHQDVSINGDATTMILLDKIPNNLLEMTWPAVIGFSFTSNTWGEVLIDGLSEIKFNESAFDNLVLPQSRKRMVKALVRHSNSAFTDIVSDKGEGSVFLLYGPPGCGKYFLVDKLLSIQYINLKRGF